MAELINLNDTSPAAPAGKTNVTWQKGASSGTDPATGYPIYPVSASVPANLVIGFILASGATGTNVGPMLVAPRACAVSKCVVVVKAADATTALSFRIRQNGTDVFSTNPSIAGGTASGTVSTFTLSASSLAVAAGDVFSIDVLTGTTSWQVTAQLET